jgi:hypothetical protein
MNFVRYDPATGKITMIGYTQPEMIERLIEAGEPMLLLDPPQYFELGQKRVNLSTLTLENTLHLP